MIGINLLKLISNFSLVYSILCYILHFTTIDKLFIVFMFNILILYLICFLQYKHKYTPFFVMALLFLPFFFFKTLNSAIFLLLNILYVSFYFTKSIYNRSYSYLIDCFKKGLRIIIMLIIIGFVSVTISSLKQYSIPFMIIYFISTIILLRSLRHLEYNNNVSKINKLNLKYSLFIIIFSFMLSIDTVRKSIFYGIKFVYNCFMYVFVYIVSLIGIGLFYIIRYVLKFFNLNINEDLFKNYNVNDSGVFDDIEQQEITDIPWFTVLIKVVFWVFVIIFIIYLIIKIFKYSSSYKKNSKKYYFEQREFIFLDKKNKNKKKNSFFKPKNPKQAVRYYYKKFLRKCLKKKIPIIKSDTTLEINKKADKIYNYNLIDEIRQIYIKVRYSNQHVTKQVFDEFYKNYKKL